MRCACCDTKLGDASTPYTDPTCQHCGKDPYSVPCPYHSDWEKPRARYLRPGDPMRPETLPGGSVPYHCPQHGLIYG